MPTVARVTEASVAPEALPRLRGPSEMTGNETAGLVRGLQDVTGVVQQIGAQAQEKADTAGVLEARRKLGDWERSWFSADNPKGVYSRKGKNAMGIVDEVQPDFDTVQGELLQGLRSRKAREAFLSYAGSTRESMLNRINSYAVDETNKYVAEEFKASMTNATDRAAQAALEGRYDDQATETIAGLQTLKSMQSLNGESDEVFQVRKQAFLTSVHSTAVNGMLGRGMVNEAATYFDENADDMSAEAAADLMARMRPLQDSENAIAFVDGIESGGTLANLGGDTSVDRVWSAQIHQESRGNQTDKNGRPLTSSAGAIGVAQIMPATGPIAAKYAGLPWDPEKFKTDKAYNEQLGRAYMQAQVQTFGSVQLGLAAYNAGPGAVSKWIGRFGDPRKGQISIDEFVARIPYSETKDYVTKIMARSGAAKPAAGSPVQAQLQALGANATLEQKLEVARGIPNPLFRKEVEQELRNRHSLRRQAENETEAAVLEDVNAKVWAAPVGVPFAKIPGLTPDQVAFVTQKGHRDNYEAIVRQRIEGTLPKTNEVLFDTLRRQSVEDPDGFAKQKNFILANSHQFSASDYESLLGRVSAITDPKKGAERADWATEEQRVANITRDLGIPSGEGGKGKRAAVSRAYMDAERAFIQQNDGKKPTPEQRDAMALKVRQNLADAIANDVDIGKRDASAASFSGEVDTSSRVRAAARLRTKLGRDPTDAEVLKYLSDAYLTRTQR